MTPIAVGGEGSFGALVRSALGGAAGAGFGGYFRVPLPWLALAIVHVLVWWCVVRLMARRRAGRRRIVILGVGLLASMVLLISPLWLSWGAGLAGV